MNKNINCFNLWNFLRLLICFMFFACAANAIDISDKIAYTISSKTADLLEKKYNMHCIGVKLGGQDNINIMGLHFQVFQKLNKAQCREILVDGVQRYLSNINLRKDFAQYLEQPFNENNIEIWLFVLSHDKTNLYYPDISFAGSTKGNISYHTDDPENQFKDKTVEEETYQEALEISSVSRIKNIFSID